MGKVLKQNVVLRPNFNGDPLVFLAGQELPKEYESMVGDHLFTEMKPANADVELNAARATGNVKDVTENKVKAKAESKDTEPKESEKKTKVPKDGASKAAWLNFAKEAGISVPDNAGRDDIREIVKAELN